MNFTELYSYHAAGAITAKRLSVSGTGLGANTANLDASYSYDSLGNVTSVQYPFAQWTNGSVVTAGPQYNYSYDVMNRIAGMTGPGSQTLVSSVTYGAANQMLQLNTSSFTETRTYNANLQLTELVSGANVHFKYNYSATQNNGRITSMQDVVSGETVTYAYDSLNRLIQAGGTGDPQGAWSQTFQFDGFGNLTQKTGSNAPTNAFLATNPATNRLNTGGAGYDAAGNLTAYGTGSFATNYTYDLENRLASVMPQGGNWGFYGYDAANQRVYQGSFNVTTWTYSNEKIYFYGADGKKLGCWSLTVNGSTYTLTASQTNIWFAGRLLTPEDRLQSRGKYFPFGEDRYSPNPANPANDQKKFATYTRDAATLLDYAYQRYYNSQLGRFHTVDPFEGSANVAAPQSLNRYSYLTSDPVNSYDPSGLAGLSLVGTGYCTVGAGEHTETVLCDLYSYSRPVMLTNAMWDDTHPAPPLNPCKPGTHPAVTTGSLQTYLKTKNNGVLASDATAFYNDGAQYGIDPRLLVALAGVETSFGKNITSGANNIFNWLANGRNSPFASVPAAIQAVAKGLATNGSYLGASTPDQVYEHFCNFAADPACNIGKQNLDLFMQQQGGSGSELRGFPCQPNNGPVQGNPVKPTPDQSWAKLRGQDDTLFSSHKTGARLMVSSNTRRRC